EAAAGDHARLLDLYRRLIALRRATPELSEPGFASTSVDFDEESRWLVLHRGGIDVALNFSPHPVRVPVQGTVPLLVTDDGARVVSSGGQAVLELPGHSAAILAQRAGA
ncbi:DUF3459 domain-containing protein, partial [Arthrobacter sp.]|uniref:DUF3459 domain-containing protein n=1 Tax=Arthrobacter sp. TaxID=1667 RepID=UPI0026DF1E71